MGFYQIGAQGHQLSDIQFIDKGKVRNGSHGISHALGHYFAHAFDRFTAILNTIELYLRSLLVSLLIQVGQYILF